MRFVETQPCDHRRVLCCLQHFISYKNLKKLKKIRFFCFFSKYFKGLTKSARFPAALYNLETFCFFGEGLILVNFWVILSFLQVFQGLNRPFRPFGRRPRAFGSVSRHVPNHPEHLAVIGDFNSTCTRPTRAFGSDRQLK